jgi:hypothetical protein
MRIFLSHASPSKPLVIRLTEGLPRHVDRWLDQHELSAGERFGQHIEMGIRRHCDFLVVFVDEAALASTWVQREVAIGLERQRDLQRTFVLPVLLGDVRDRLGELGLAADQWLHLDARDHSEAGVAASAAALQAELFKHASELVERLRSADRHALIDDFAAELAEFEQVAFRWVASMASRIEVIVATLPPQDHIRDCLAAYNAVANRFIPGLAQHRDRLCAAWNDQRILVKHIGALLDFIEDRVYHGALFALNDVLGLLHQAMVSESEQRLEAAWLAESEARKAELLAQAQDRLQQMTAQASELLGDLTASIE